MSFRIEVYEARHLPMAQAFNTRLRAAGANSPVMLAASPSAFLPDSPLSSEARIVVDDEGVRGGYVLQWRDFWGSGKPHRVCAFQSPVSEGIIDRKYAIVGLTMVRHALSVNPLLYTVGMGGINRPLPRMLKSLGFSQNLVPFVLRVNRPARFFSQAAHLRSSQLRRILLELVRLSGAGALGILGWQFMRAAFNYDRSVTFVPTDTLDDIADEIWLNSRDQYPLLAVRDSAMLRALYPLGQHKYRRMVVRRAGRYVGWAVLVEKQMEGNQYFGDMKVGVVADCLATPSNAAFVMQAAAEYLSELRVDVTVANFQHPAWVEGSRRAGFFVGPSNHGFTMSPSLLELLKPIPGGSTLVHLSRGDSDGLANL